MKGIREESGRERERERLSFFKSVVDVQFVN